jgi:hypothetical protein
MAKAKGSSFSKSSTKAGSAAYNTANKVRVAKEELAKTKKDIKESKKTEYAYANPIILSKPKKTAKMAKEMLAKQKDKTKALGVKKGQISQNISDRSRSASRAAGIAKRVTKKGK